MYENKAMCAKCGGECCKEFPGLCLPTDFGRPADRRRRITKALESGRYCLERSIPSKILSVRPATKGREGVLIDGVHKGQTICTFLQDDGCELTIKKRPYDCRTLEPRKDRKCIDRGMSANRMITKWIPLQPMLRRIVREIRAGRASMNNSSKRRDKMELYKKKALEHITKRLDELDLMQAIVITPTGIGWRVEVIRYEMGMMFRELRNEESNNDNGRNEKVD